MANTLRFKRGLASGIPTALAGEPLFTTDTFDLYIGNGTTNTRFQKYIASGATTQILRGDGSLYTFPLAISSPSTGQVLKYNGTSWVNDSDSGITGSGSAGQVAYFTGATTQAGSNNLFWDATNNRLGILTNTPTTSFHINSGASTQGGAIFGKGSYNYATVSQLGSSGDALFGAGVIASATAGEVAKSVGDVGHYIKMQISDGITFHTNITGAAGTSLARGTNERARFFASTGNFGINTGATDSGQRLQVIGTGYFSDSVGIGTTSLTPALLNIVGSGTQDRAVSIAKTFTGGATRYGILQFNTVNSDVNGTVMNNYSQFVTQAATFTLTNAYHFYNADISVGAGSTITNQYVYFASPIANATNNYGFYGNIGAGTNRWNLYMNGTANNYMAGSLGIGSTSLTGQNLVVSKNITGASITYNVVSAGEIRSDVTIAHMYLSQPSTQATTFTLSQLYHFRATQGTIGTNSTITNQYGFAVQNTLIGAATNIGFFSDLAAATGRWNFYANGTALNYLNGSLLIGSTTDSGEKLQVTGTTKITGNTIISGNLGVGVATAGASLHVGGAISSTPTGSGVLMGLQSNYAVVHLNGSDGGLIDFSVSGTDTRGRIIYANASDSMQFGTTNGTTKMTLDASGNLGLGVTPSAWRSAAKAFQVGTTSSVYNVANGTFIGNNVYSNSTPSDIYIQNGYAGVYGMTNVGTHIWGIAPSGTAGNAITFTQAMTLDASGNLGIGITNPTQRLHVSGNALFTGYVESNSGVYFSGNVGGPFIWVRDNYSLRFGTNDTERMRLTATGNLLIGSTTDSGEKLQVTGTAKITGATTMLSTLAVNGSAIGRVDGIRINGASVTQSSNTYNAFISTTTTQGIDIGGSLGLGGEVGGDNAAFAVISGRKENSISGNYAGYFAISTIDGGASMTEKFRISSLGAATFSSSVTVTSNLTVDTNTLFVDATNNRVGIGTLLPNGKLSIIGSLGEFRVLDSGAELYFTRNGNNDILANGGTSADLTIGANNNLIFKAGSGLTERMRITSGGNVLVGTTTDSGYKLRVNGTSYYDDNARFPNNKGVIFVQTGGSLLGSISMDTGNRVTIDNNGFSGVSVATDHTFLGGNFSVGHSGAVFGGGTRAMSMLNGTAPSSSFADAFLMYSNDVTAGNAAPHFRTENGAVIKLYQETTSVGNSIFSQGGGNSVLDDSTFDGYTLRQIVKALRNQGILA